MFLFKDKVIEFFREIAKSTMGWFFGFKLYLIINDNGEILSRFI
ncbi:MAG: hypothetical protein D6707_05875 [Bacteroidetes bacterium]|nr:MAG: hypothetical protein D6707_05875 [Bacteroidota bacterium]